MKRPYEVLNPTLLKELLFESPDTLSIPNGTFDSDGLPNKDYYNYLAKEVFCSFFTMGYANSEGTNQYAGLYMGGAFIELGDETKNRIANEAFKKYVPDFVAGQKGHSYLDSCINSALIDVSKATGNPEDSNWFDGPRGRIFLVNGKYYFTVWTSTHERYATMMPVFLKVIKACGLKPEEIIWEWYNTFDTTLWSDGRYQLTDWAGIQVVIRGLAPSKVPAGQSEPPAINPAAVDADGYRLPPQEEKKVESELLKKIKELQTKQAELEADSHVKGATWTQGERNQYKLMMANLDAEIQTLAAAEKAGETDISKVIIKTIDSLEGSEQEVVPADILYAELEKRLSKYGTSAVAIIRNLKDRGIDIKKALREIHTKHGSKVSSKLLLGSLEELLKENSGVEVFSPNSMTKLSHLNSVDDFLKTFVGHKLGELQDKLSFTRLYVMNKFNSANGDDQQQKIASLLDHAFSFINFRLLDPLRKKVDDADSIERKNPEYIAKHQAKMAILRNKFMAQRKGDEALVKKFTDEYNDFEGFPSTYSKNMKDMDEARKLIWSTPLSLSEVLPSPNDSAVDKERYAAVKKAFDDFKQGND